MEMSLQEILKLAAVDTVLGMGTVFTVLIIISLCIWALGVAFKQEEPKAAPEEKVHVNFFLPKSKYSKTMASHLWSTENSTMAFAIFLDNSSLR